MNISYINISPNVVINTKYDLNASVSIVSPEKTLIVFFIDSERQNNASS